MIFNPEAETMPRPRLEAIQLERLRETLERVYHRVPLHKQRLDDAGVKPDDFNHLSDLTRLPLTTKTDLRDHYPFGLFAVPREEVARIHTSSGTGGKPTVVGYTENDIRVWAEVCARSLGCAGAEPGETLHNAYGYGLFTGGLGLHYGAERLGMTVVPASGGQTARQVSLIRDFRPHGISCTPSYALNLADHLDDLGLDAGTLGIRYGVFGAEPWSETMREKIQEGLHLTAVDIYGLSEVIGPGVACECREEQAGAHVFEDHFLVEVIDPDTLEPAAPGEEGELVFTTLTKEAFPVIRFRTGDIASLITEPCSCGRTTYRMSRVKGRTDDMLIVRGMNVFPSEIERTLLTIEGLAPHYQVMLSRQGVLDQLTVQVEVTPPFWTTTESDLNEDRRGRRLRDAALHRLHSELGIRVDVELCPPRAIPRSEGKAVRVVDMRDGRDSTG